LSSIGTFDVASQFHSIAKHRMTTFPFRLNPVVDALRSLYGVVTDFAGYLGGLVEEMKKSENSTISRTGMLLEAAKYGFGIGYITSVVVIALGQLILGNPLSAITTVATAAVGSNPIAMTCAALGAIYYGWSALSDEERDAVIHKLGAGLDIGIELIKSIAAFVVAKAKDLLSPEKRLEVKRSISDAARLFGRTLADVTGSIAGRVIGVASSVKDSAVDAAGMIRNTAGDAADAIKGTASETAESVKNTAADVADSIKDGAKSAYDFAADKLRTKQKKAKSVSAAKESDSH
jgi:hypothetical protein